MTIVINNNSFTDDNIIDISVDHKIDELSTTLPIDEAHIKLHITDEQAALFKYNTEFSIIDNENLSKTGKFYAREITQSGIGIYEIYGVSIVGILSDRNFAGKMFIKSNGLYYTFGEAVAEIIGSGVSYSFEDTSSEFDIQGWIGHCSAREAIRHLCLAAGVVAYMDDSGNLKFRRTFGDQTFGDRPQQHSYQQDEVFDNFSIKESTQYSHYACDMYTFSTSPLSGDQYVTDTDGKLYYYTVEKIRTANPDFPSGQPTNELYIQSEMLISSRTFANDVLSRVTKYYKGNMTLEFTAVTDDYKTNSVGFYTGEKMVYGYPASISMAYGHSNVIKYVCNMAYTQASRTITLNYKNDSGDLLVQKTVYKGKEINFTVQNPQTITVKVDERHKIIYTPKKYTTTINDINNTIRTVDIICEASIIHDGDILEIYGVHSAEKSGGLLKIGGKVYE